ncbi:MAG TPA: FUSC family protein [Candidatus Sulfotelmatobacter sp.]|nr:FUSC family protein [Candidatus Sulfotelmatobacter sp.]
MSRWPGINEWLFSAKTFAAAMLAVYIAFAMGLERPYWAMATVYIVSQPLTGTLRSKSLYRLLGTLIGAAAAVTLVPNLVAAPALLSAALALWTGACLYLALLDRTPRSYVFLLAGYTAGLIGFPAVDTPLAIWDIAVSRVEEIWLGIICATVVGTVVFPRALGPTLSERILAWVGSASSWAEQALGGDVDPGGETAHLRLAADAVELRLLASHLAYDASKWEVATRWVREAQRRMVFMLPLLSSVGDRLTALKAAGGATPELEHLLADLRQWVRAGTPPPRSEAQRLRTAIAQLEVKTDPREGWNAMMRSSLLLRLHELVNVRQDLRDLRRHIETGGGPLRTPLAIPSDRLELMHHDHSLALLSGLAAMLTILLVCGVWIATGWHAGSGSAALASAACCLFAAMDDPTPALKSFLVVAVLSILAVGIGLFAILPVVHDFETLVLALGAFFIPSGLLMAMPPTQALGTALSFVTATLLSLQGAYAADFVTYADGSIAALLGVGAAVVMTALIRSVGAEWSARRLLRTGWRDLASLPDQATPHERNLLAGLLLDRLGLLVPRLATVGAGNDLAAIDVLADLRVGINMIELQRHRDMMPPSVRQTVDTVLSGTARHFAAQVAVGRAEPPAPALLGDIDHALEVTVNTLGGHSRNPLLQLVGIRRALFADAPPYRPARPPPDGEALVETAA